MRSFSMRHEFPIECYAFLNQPDSFNNQVLNIAIDNSRFPYFAANKTISISEILVLAESSENPLVSQGIILLPPNIVATIVSGVDPSSKVNSQPMSAITAPDIPQVAFDYSSAINPGNFMIVNPKSNNYQLSNDSIKDLILIVYYHL